jgi:hypothetical protein
MFILKKKTKAGGSTGTYTKAAIVLGFFAALRGTFVAFQYLNVNQYLQ